MNEHLQGGYLNDGIDHSEDESRPRTCRLCGDTYVAANLFFTTCECCDSELVTVVLDYYKDQAE
jgi:hypothetical protein